MSARRALTSLAALAIAAVIAYGALASATTSVRAAGAGGPADPALVTRGRTLFAVHCSTCHGIEGAGTRQGPDIRRSGAAAADFQLATGRMPLDAPFATSVRKRPSFDRADIRALVAFVASLDDGPPIPSVDTRRASLSAGQQLFGNNCAGCHNAVGAGGALGPEVTAPALDDATAVQVVEAMRTGPGPMPVFGPDTLSAHQADAIAGYVQYLHHPDDRGGNGLGHVGPIPEGFVAWVLGLGVLLVVCRWIGARA